LLANRESGEIRIAIVSEQRVFGESLAYALDDDTGFSIDAVVRAPTDAGLRSARIAVVIVDLEGLETVIENAVPQVREHAPHAGIIVLSSRGNPETLHRSIESGADGHVSKEKGLDELRRAIHCVAEGISFVDPRSGAAPVRTPAPPPREPALAQLSPREHDVLHLLAEGYSNRDIAVALNVAHKTVKNHVSNILSKLQSTSRTQAVIQALRRGIV
jgi:two-component system NarL family response regulator